MQRTLLIITALLWICATSSGRPNFVIILTDDQDLCMDSLLPMANVKRLIGDSGTTFVNAFTTSPICCPSRASILTGLHAHNHKTFNNSRDGGCYGDNWIQNMEGIATFPAQLKKSGYKTFYAGKYLNQYHGKHVPAEYDDFYGLQGNSKYYNFSLNVNGEIKHYFEGEYLTDLILNASVNFLNQKSEDLSDASPFLMIIAPPAPHAPFTPSPEFVDTKVNMVVPRTPNFNNGSEGKHWLLTMPPEKLSNCTVELIDEYFQNRWRTLLSVDKLVGRVVAELEAKNLLDDTYIFYTSDNGYHLGQFSQPWDKRQPYECDIRVPLLVRGPGISKKSMNNELVALLDIGATVTQLADVLDFESDGHSFADFMRRDEMKDGHEESSDNKEKGRLNLLIEYWGEGNAITYNPDCPWRVKDDLNQCNLDAGCKCQDAWNNTYSCIRNIEPGFDYLYCRFKDHENYVEAYNLLKDPYQLNNIGFTDPPSIRSQYDLLIERLTACKGKNCFSV